MAEGTSCQVRAHFFHTFGIHWVQLAIRLVALHEIAKRDPEALRMGLEASVAYRALLVYEVWGSKQKKKHGPTDLP